MGCSHFIVGRDHTGVSNFYHSSANETLFNKLGEIGIKPLFFEPIGFNAITKSYEVESNNQNWFNIDGTNIRQKLSLGKKVEDWMMRKEVQEALLQITPNEETMFVEN